MTLDSYVWPIFLGLTGTQSTSSIDRLQTTNYHLIRVRWLFREAYSPTTVKTYRTFLVSFIFKMCESKVRFIEKKKCKYLRRYRVSQIWQDNLVFPKRKGNRNIWIIYQRLLGCLRNMSAILKFAILDQDYFVLKSEDNNVAYQIREEFSEKCICRRPYVLRFRS